MYVFDWYQIILRLTINNSPVSMPFKGEEPKKGPAIVRSVLSSVGGIKDRIQTAIEAIQAISLG